MDGKSVNSGWGELHNPILISISVWPIVFAAVVAQAFKTYATFRVERGIRLMELEQLVGSNSFGSVMKQPFLLRRLDLLTLFIFLVWCLSPIGSQALQRVYTFERGTVVESVPAYYGKTFGPNLLFGTESNLTDAERGNLMQTTSVYYISSFMPTSPLVQSGGDQARYSEDTYNHPLNFGINPNYYGIPTVVPPGFNPPQDDIAVSGVLQPFEYFTFNTTSSSYAFTCGNWTQLRRSAINDNMTFSLSQTFGLNLSRADENATTLSKLAFATLTDTKAADLHINETTDAYNDSEYLGVANPSWEYSYIECGFQQQFFQTRVQCSTDVIGKSYVPNCADNGTDQLDASTVPKDWYTTLGDFSFDFVTFGNPFAFSNITTLSKSGSRSHPGHGSADVKC